MKFAIDKSLGDLGIKSIVIGIAKNINPQAELSPHVRWPHRAALGGDGHVGGGLDPRRAAAAAHRRDASKIGRASCRERV